MASKPSVRDSTENVHADVRVGLEDHAFSAHLLDAAVDDMFFELEIRDAVAEQAADAVILFKNRDGVAGAAQLLCGSKARGAAADDGNTLAIACSGGSGESSLRPRRAPRWNAR